MKAEAVMCDHPLGFIAKLITPDRLGHKDDKPKLRYGFFLLSSGLRLRILLFQWTIFLASKWLKILDC